MKTILFQGDSVTDSGRNREAFHDLGTGYPCLIASALGRKYPGKYTFLNRGISGNKVTDLIGRWKRDCINLKPDYLSIMIGVNDVWHELENSDGTDTEIYEKVYDVLLYETKKMLPDVKIVLMEPYVLEGEWLRKSDEFRILIDEKRSVVKRLAEKYGLWLIPTQEILDEAKKEAGALYWTGEGVHPTYAGHQVIADAWIQEFERIAAE